MMYIISVVAELLVLVSCQFALLIMCYVIVLYLESFTSTF